MPLPIVQRSVTTPVWVIVTKVSAWAWIPERMVIPTAANEANILRLIE